MIKKSICIVMLAFSCAHQASAEIKKINSFSEAKDVLEKANTKTPVFFDVDDTIFIKEWPVLQNRYSKKVVVKNFLEESCVGCKITEDELEKITFEAPEILIEPEIIKIIKNLQNKNVPVIALTSRATGNWGLMKNLEEKLFMILKGFDIDFSSSFPIKVPVFNQKDLIFYKGIGFVPRDENGNEKTDKGDILMQLLEKAKIVPEHIIFFDDKSSQLKKVNEAIMLWNKNNNKNDSNKKEILFSGFCYSGVDKLSDDFDENIVKIQIEKLLSSGILLGEKEAKNLFEEQEDDCLLFEDNDDSDRSGSFYDPDGIEEKFEEL